MNARRSVQRLLGATLLILAAACNSDKVSGVSEASKVKTGNLTVTVSGLPQGTSANVSVTGAATYAVTGTRTLTALTVGSWSVSASSVTANNVTYAPQPATQTVSIENNRTATATVTYAAQPTTGTVNVTVTGLPSGANASAVLTSPSGSNQLSGTTSMTGPAGNWSLTASPVQFGGFTYTPAQATSSGTLVAGGTLNLSVQYSLSTGAIAVSIAGLPSGSASNVDITGPNGYAHTVAATETITNLTPGSYTVTASNVTAGTSTYAPTPATQAVTVSASLTASPAAVTYAATAAASDDDLSIDFAYVTQAVQRPDGSVPLVVGRAALLRVFVIDNRTNSLTPKVRARIYNGSTLLQTATLTAPEASVRTTTSEGVLNSSWNLQIPAANVTTGLRVLVDVDPSNEISEANETNNQWPRSGTPQPYTVNNVPDFNVKFVPVNVAGLTGRVTESNTNTFLTTLKLIYPILGINVSVRAPFTSSAPALQSNDGNGAWLTVLNELYTLQRTEGPATTHYYGVLQVTYTSGVAGYGYVPGRAAIGWDYGYNTANGGSNSAVAAHEFGHNFSRPHTPCGGVAGGDVTYPYEGGTIGMFGWNSTTGNIIQTNATDIMGYCSNQWVSDWTWTKIMTYRQSSGYVSESGEGDGLLVWGRVVDGKVILEPAFRVKAAPTRASATGTHRLEILDRRGGVLTDMAIDAEKVDHVLDHDERQFAVVLPWSAKLERSLATIRVRDVRSPLAAAARTSLKATEVVQDTAPVLAEPQEAVEAPSSNRTRVRWNKSAYPMAMVRDAQTGQIMAFLRNSGDEFVGATSRPVDIVYSDGVRSLVKRHGRR